MFILSSHAAHVGGRVEDKGRAVSLQHVDYDMIVHTVRNGDQRRVRSYFDQLFGSNSASVVLVLPSTLLLPESDRVCLVSGTPVSQTTTVLRSTKYEVRYTTT